jgi:hypothetical protein
MTILIGVLLLAWALYDTACYLAGRRPVTLRHPARAERRITRWRLDGLIDARTYRRAMSALAHTPPKGRKP